MVFGTEDSREQKASQNSFLRNLITVLWFYRRHPLVKIMVSEDTSLDFPVKGKIVVITGGGAGIGSFRSAGRVPMLSVSSL